MNPWSRYGNFRVPRRHHVQRAAVLAKCLTRVRSATFARHAWAMGSSSNNSPRFRIPPTLRSGQSSAPTTCRLPNCAPRNGEVHRSVTAKAPGSARKARSSPCDLEQNPDRKGATSRSRRRIRRGRSCSRTFNPGSPLNAALCSCGRSRFKPHPREPRWREAPRDKD